MDKAQKNQKDNGYIRKVKRKKFLPGLDIELKSSAVYSEVYNPDILTRPGQNFSYLVPISSGEAFLSAACPFKKMNAM